MLQLLIFAGIGLLAMISEILNFSKIMSLLFRLATLGSIVSLTFNYGVSSEWFGKMMVEDRFSHTFTLVSSILLAAWTFSFARTIGEDKNRNDFIALICFSMVGGTMLLGFNHLVVLFLGIEILSIPVYVLVGSSKRNLKSNEAAFKYFLMGAFSSAILLFGMAFIYGATGSFFIDEISRLHEMGAGDMPYYFDMGLVLIIAAMAFKMAAIPFHYWAPDVYEGAPNAMTVYMATLVKTFALAATFRLIAILFNGVENDHTMGLTILCVLSMLGGNIMGAVQDNPKRVFAYSGIGHTGFMLMAILVNGGLGAKTLLYYAITYSFSVLLAFVVLDKVLVKDDFYWSIGDFKGLVKRSPLLAVAMTLALLSMAGIPPLSGFFAKFFIFRAAFTNQHYVAVGAAIIASLIAVYYYFKFIINMFAKEPDADSAGSIKLTGWETTVVYSFSAIIIFLGLFPDALMDMINF